jgi:Ohr subfamily peroxiredoxin
MTSRRDADAAPGIAALSPSTKRKSTMAIKPEKILYTAHTLTTGGRDGAARSSDGELDVKLATPGAGTPGTNPEQLFAVGWSACFLGAMGLAAKQRKIALPADASVEAEVDLGQTGDGYLLAMRLNVHVPGLDRALVIALAQDAHETCPYSKATRGNIDVVISVI